MKRIIGLLLTLTLVLVCALALADVSINDTNFPDEAFWNVIKAFDTDGDGKLSDDETEEVIVMNVTGQGCTSLKGIEHFTALKKLYSSGNQLTSLDLSSNTALVEFRIDGNQPERLDLSKNTALETFSCDESQLTSLDLSNNTALKWFN